MRVTVEMPDEPTHHLWKWVRSTSAEGYGYAQVLSRLLVESSPKLDFKVGDVVAANPGSVTAPAIIKSIVEHRGVQFLTVARGDNVFVWQATNVELVSRIEAE